MFLKFKATVRNPDELKRMIELQGYSQRSFASKIHVTYEHLNLVINGKVTCSMRYASKVSTALDSKVESIFEVEEVQG